MIEIYEIDAERAQKSAARFGIAVTPLQRVFIMEEDGEIGIGVLALDGAAVMIKEVKTDKPFLYFDLLARSLLAVTRDMSPIKVRVKADPYYLRFGFVQNDDFMEILNTDINFTAACADHSEKTDCPSGCAGCKTGKK